MTIRVRELRRWTEYRRVDANERPIYRWRFWRGQWEGRARIGDPWEPLVWSRVPSDVRLRYHEAVKAC